MGDRPSARLPLTLTLTLVLALGTYGCGLTNDDTEPGGTYGPICDELASATQAPRDWVSDDGRLTLRPAEAAQLILGFGTGAAASGDTESPQARIRNLLSSRLDGEGRPLSRQERTDLEHLQQWTLENCD